MLRLSVRQVCRICCDSARRILTPTFPYTPVAVTRWCAVRHGFVPFGDVHAEMQEVMRDTDTTFVLV